MDIQIVSQLRELGISYVGDVPWGTHICAFYQEDQDYIDIVIPYLQAGLTNNELCIWVLPLWLSPAGSISLLQRKIPQLEKKREQIKVYAHDEWYLKSSDTYDAEAIMQEWTKQCKYARDNNYDGIRVCGSPVWNHKNTWKKIMEYETVLEERIGYTNLVALCLYCLSDLEIHQILDLTSNHEFAFIKCDHDWKYSAKIAELNRLEQVVQMAAGIVHEVRNPMTTVIALMQLLQDKQELQSYHSLFSTIEDELHRANDIISGYLSLVGQKNRQIKNHNLNQILQDLLPLMQAEAKKQHKTIRLLPGKIVDIAVDQKEIRQVILNLVNNGLESMDCDGVLEIKTYMRKNHVVLAIKDQGHGIPSELLENLGKPFITTKESGTGLGLYVTFKILEQYHTKVKVDSSLKGTTFTISFPLKYERSS